MDGADVCRTSSRASRRPPDVIAAVAILDSRWRRRKWHQPRPGAAFSTPIEEWGARWRPFRFRRPSWMTSFAEPRMRSSKMAAGSGRAAILLLTPQWGSKRPPYTTLISCSESRHYLNQCWFSINWTIGDKFQMLLKFKYFHCRKLIWKCRVENTDHFVWVLMCWYSHVRMVSSWLSLQ